MTNLIDNLILLKNSKQSLIDKINAKVQDSDKQELEIDCEWEDINELLSKVKVKRDWSEELDANEIYTQICSDTRNETITTNVTTIGDYSMYNQTYLPELTANSCTSIGEYAFYNCTDLTNISVENCKSIGAYAFYNTASLEAVNLPKITSVGQGAFQKSGIKTATVGCTSLPVESFCSCTNLTTITAPNITRVANYALYGDSSLTTISTDTDTITVSTWAFYDCTSFNDQTFLQKVSSISGISAFANTGITEITNDKIEQLSYSNVFANCLKLETVTLENCTYISGNAPFYNCTALRSVVLPNVVSITCSGDTSALFYNCTALETVYLPKVTDANGVFYNNTSLTSISLPALASRTYNTTLVNNCTNLKTLDLSGLKVCYTKSAYLVRNCYKLESINLSSLYGYSTSTSSSYAWQTMNYISNCGISELSLPAFIILYPYDVGTISYNNKYLTKLDLPNLQVCKYGCTTTGNYSARILSGGHPLLKTLNIPQLSSITCYATQGWMHAYNPGSITDIDKTCPAYLDAMMRYRMDLYPTTYETDVEYITYYERRYGGTIDGTLSNANYFNAGKHSPSSANGMYIGLEKIELPKLSYWYTRNSETYPVFKELHNLTTLSLGDGSFTPSTTSLTGYFVSHAYNLREVVLNYPKVITASTAISTIFYDCPHLTGAIKSFTNTVKTYYYANESGAKDLYFYVPDDLVDSYKSATNWSAYADQIKSISELAALSIDLSITKIEDSQYKDDSALTTVAGYGITEVADYGFYNTSATRILFSSCTNVGDFAFAKSVNLAEIQLAWTSINSIGKYAFNETKLTSVTATALTILADGVFKDCTALATCNLAAVKSIGKEALENTALSMITYATLLNIDKQAFKNCANLTSATLAAVTTIADEAFMNDALATISFPTLTTLGSSAFENNQLTTVTLPKIIVIGDRAFANNTEITTINLYGAMSIGKDVFDGCTALTDITFEGYSMPTCGNLPETCTLHVRASLVDEFTEKFPHNTIVGDVA